MEGNGETRSKLSSETVKEGGRMEDLRADGRIILKWILKE
jgi:hypothetical protein